MFRLETKNKPRGKLVRDSENDDSTKCVRVYKASPDDLILQLWSGKRYMLVALEPAEARAIAEELVNVANEIQMKPLPLSELRKIIGVADTNE